MGELLICRTSIFVEMETVWIVNVSCHVSTPTDNNLIKFNRNGVRHKSFQSGGGGGGISSKTPKEFKTNEHQLFLVWFGSPNSTGRGHRIAYAFNMGLRTSWLRPHVLSSAHAALSPTTGRGRRSTTWPSRFSRAISYFIGLNYIDIGLIKPFAWHGNLNYYCCNFIDIHSAVFLKKLWSAGPLISNYHFIRFFVRCCS